MKRFLAAWVGLLLLSLIWVAPGRAHALLVRSQPAANAELSQPPSSIEMWFSEPLESTFTGARLLTSAGEEVDTGAPVLDPSDATHLSVPVGELQPGIYTVAWQTLSQVDGHEWYGSFPFTVLNPDGSRPAGGAATVAGGDRGELPTPAETVTRWLTLAGAMLLLGVPLFRRALAMPAEGEEVLLPHAGAPALRLLWLALLLLIAGDWAQLLLQMLRLGGLAQVPGLLLETRVGQLALARQLLAATALMIALTLPQPGPLHNRERPFFFVTGAYAAILALLLLLGSGRDLGILIAFALFVAGGAMFLAGWLSPARETAVARRTWDGVILSAAAALFTLSTSSHAGAVPGSAWAVLADYLHLLAAAAWLGGLLLLATLIWQHWREDSANATGRLRLLRRFSFLASFSVFVLVFTGLFNSLVELPALESLWTTAYGRVLLLKLVLVALALGVALLNNLLVHRGRDEHSLARRMRRLKRQIAVEVGAASLLLLSVAVLVQTPAPRSVAEQQPFQPQLPFNTTTSAGDLYFHAQVSPNQIGNNRFWMHLYHPAGSDVGEVQLVRLMFDYQEAGLGQSSVDLQPLGRDTFAAEGAYLNQPGSWEVSVYVRRRGLDDTLATFALEVPEAGPAGSARSPWQNPIPAISPAASAGVVLVFLGLIPVLWRQPLRARLPRRFPALRIGGSVLVVAGLLVLALVALGPLAGDEAGVPAAARTNPIEATEASLEQGRVLYQENCLQCHGPSGLGDGPVGLTLQPPPANLQVHMVPGVHSDGQIFEWLTNGVPDTPMPAFGQTLSEEERWHVVNYIRTLVPEEEQQ